MEGNLSLQQIRGLVFKFTEYIRTLSILCSVKTKKI